MKRTDMKFEHYMFAYIIFITFLVYINIQKINEPTPISTCCKATTRVIEYDDKDTKHWCLDCKKWCEIEYE